MFNNKNKSITTPPYRNAFTLAEVLITLVIIGVIAAITVPVMITKYQEQQTISKLKKFQSTISGALNHAILNNQTVDTWEYETDDSSPKKLAQYFKPYLSIIKDCGEEEGCVYDGKYKYLNGNEHSVNYNTNPSYYKLILNDGSMIWLRGDKKEEHCSTTEGGWDNTCGLFMVDLNGLKGPNTMGKDAFTFLILKDRIVPRKDDNCYLNSFGYGCAGFILTNNHMNYTSL